jgi:hypothetical protein
MERSKLLGKGRGADMVAEMVAVMFMSRDYAHRAHLKTGSYSQHMALNEFYDMEDGDDVIDLADRLAEAAQGTWGKLDIPYVEMMGNVDKPADGLKMHLEKIQELGDQCGDRALGAIYDEIVLLYKQTIYKLKELA